jgi:hypothetical protein
LEINLLTFEKTSKLITFILVFAVYCYTYAGYNQKVDKFSFYSASEDSLIVHQLANFVKQCQAKYNRIFDYIYDHDVAIYLASSKEEYDKFNLKNVPEWSSGVAYTRLRKIILKPGSYYDPGRYRETLFHEIAHMYIADVSTNNPIPRWLNEGISMYLSEKNISWQESIIVGNALSAGNLIELNAIDSVLLFMNAEAELAYLESFLAVQFLVSKVGEKGLVEIVKEFSYSSSLDDVFEKLVGYSYFEFEIEWYDDLKNRYRWMSLLQFENLFWFLLIFIIFLAYFLKKMRNRRILREWETDDYFDPEM